MVEKLKGTLKNVKERDSTVCRSHGLALKQGEEFAHSFNVKQIECIEAKLTKFKQDMEALENKKRSYDSIFKGIHKQHFKKGEGKKKTAESQMKERGGRLKPTSNEFMESELEMIFSN